MSEIGERLDRWTSKQRGEQSDPDQKNSKTGKNG